jgi:RimJ/RimL family protein N-acetyltransferase
VENVIEVRGDGIILRDGRVEDVDARIRWVTVEMEWGEWDGPWEGNEPIPAEKIEEARTNMAAALSKTPPTPRNMLYIQRIGGPLLGWVSAYRYDPADCSIWVGIDICEPAFWGKGIGTEALGLWIDYLFGSMSLDRIRMSTWSGNARMMRCADKCGFALVERIPDAREVRGERYMLSRKDWEAARQ